MVVDRFTPLRHAAGVVRCRAALRMQTEDSFSTDAEVIQTYQLTLHELVQQ